MNWVGDIDDKFFETLLASRSNKLFLCSGGGDAHISLGAADHVIAAGRPRIIVGVGKIFSAALAIFVVGKTRLVYPTTRFFDHEPETEMGKVTTRQQGREFKESQWLMRTCCELYGKYTKRPAEWWRQQIEKKELFYFGATEAVEWGVADRIL